MYLSYNVFLSIWHSVKIHHIVAILLSLTIGTTRNQVTTDKLIQFIASDF